MIDYKTAYTRENRKKRHFTVEKLVAAITMQRFMRNVSVKADKGNRWNFSPSHDNGCATVGVVRLHNVPTLHTSE